MFREMLEHSRQSWSHVLHGQSSTAEKVECGLEAVAGAAAVYALGRSGFSSIARRTAVAQNVANGERALPVLKLTGAAESAAPKLVAESTLTAQPAEVAWKELTFARTQRIQLMGGETGAELHERIRQAVTKGFEAVRQPTQITTPSWYTYDASKVLGIDNAVAVMTSTCKHELPSMTFVGIRGPGWMQSVERPWLANRMALKASWESPNGVWQYRLQDLGRELTQAEKNAIYDLM